MCCLKLYNGYSSSYFSIILALSIGLGIVDNITIDEINILRASLLAMARAVSDLSISPDLVLIDGNKKIPLEINQETIVKGDTISSSIAAASVIAKVQRDRISGKGDIKSCYCSTCSI